MSPALVKKYLEAARGASPTISFSSRKGLTSRRIPVVADTDRDKYCVRRIIEFYKRQRTDYADYFLAAWRFRHREALGRPGTSLAEVAAEAGISAKYLATGLVDPDGTEPTRSGRSPRSVDVARCSRRRRHGSEAEAAQGGLRADARFRRRASPAAHAGGEESDRPRHQ